MIKFKKISALIICLSLAALMFAGCGDTKPTVAPVEPTPTPAVAEETPTPTPTPEPYDGPLYTFDYVEYESGKIEVVVNIPVEVDPMEITEIIVPREIDGKLVTKLPWDFLGSRSGWGGRRGFMRVTKWGTDEDGNKIPLEWNNDAEIWLEKIVFPDSLEYIDYGIFWMSIPTLEEMIFEGADNLDYVGTAPFGGATVEENLAEDNDGFWILGKYLMYLIPEENIVLPNNVKRIAPQLLYPCYNPSYRADKIKTITINEGCEEIGLSFLYEKVDLEWIYIPDSVTKIADKICSDEHDAELKANVTIKCHSGSYAEAWANDHGFKVEIV